MAKQKPPRGPRRTRAHIIASQSHNYLEKFFIDKGHTVERPGADYGYDVFVNTFDQEGYAEPGGILIQLKASDNLEYSDDRNFISYAINIKHHKLWIKETMPVFLVLFDAQKKLAYRLYYQDYFRSDPSRKPGKDAKLITLRIPVANKFTEATVDYIRERKLLIQAQVERVKHHG